LSLNTGLSAKDLTSHNFFLLFFIMVFHNYHRRH